MMFTIEFFRIRKEDNAHATLARVTHLASDLEGARVKARSLFDVGTLNMPQNPDGLRILDEDGNEVFFLDAGDRRFLGQGFFSRDQCIYSV
jgi:hypothetical protein